MAQASYDLARLRHNGLITRCPHSNTYHLTGDGLRFAIFYTKVCNRVLAPLFTADQPQAPPETPQRPAHHRPPRGRPHRPRPAAFGSLKTRLNCQSPRPKGSLDPKGR